MLNNKYKCIFILLVKGADWTWKSTVVWGGRTASVHLDADFSILWNGAGGMNTILLKDIPSAGVLWLWRKLESVFLGQDIFLFLEWPWNKICTIFMNIKQFYKSCCPLVVMSF